MAISELPNDAIALDRSFDLLLYFSTLISRSISIIKHAEVI